MYCRECGKELAEGNLFCQFCGTKVEFDDEPVNQIPDQAEENQKIEPEQIADAVDYSTQNTPDYYYQTQPKKSRAWIIVVAIAAAAIVLASAGVGSFILARSLKSEIEFLNADDDSVIKTKSADISIYAGADNTDGKPVSRAKYSGGGYKIKKLKDGEYTLEAEIDGYLPIVQTIKVENRKVAPIYLSPLPKKGTVAFRVDWSGDQDLDICVYDSEINEYISIGYEAAADEIHVGKDNDSAKKFEIAYIPDAKEDIERIIYIVDSKAAKKDASSTMEKDGVTVIAYDSDGELLKVKADESMSAPIWSVATLCGGNVSDDSSDYIEKCDGINSWTKYLKEGQLGRLEGKIATLNSKDGAIPVFDPSVDNYSPGTRNESKKWDKTVFYAMEQRLQTPGYYDKNMCLLKKLQVISGITGNTVDYDVYLNPDTLLPNKIVSIEYLTNGIEVYEYYYDNDGKVSFIFNYITDNYVSTYATRDKAGDRYLFDQDNMMTWRMVKNGKSENYCYGAAEADRLKESSWDRNSIIEYSTLGTEYKGNYDAKEKQMINYAYNTYNMVLNTETVGRIIGIVYADNYNPYSDASVELYDRTFENLLYTTSPNSDGEYCIYVPGDEYEYNLIIKDNDSDSECSIYDVSLSENSLAVYVDSAFFFPSNNTEQDVNLYIGDALYGYGSSIKDAQIYVRNGINNRSGNVCLETQTNSDGCAQLRLRPGVYTVEAKKSGYESIYYTIVSNPNESNWYEYYTPPTLNEGEYAIVLSWGEYPEDLDSHLFTNTAEGTSNHVWYAEKYDSLNSYLDVDDTSSYGPETVTIMSFNQNNYYKYCVIDYTNSSMGRYDSYDMSYSSATVSVYSAGGHVSTFHVPVNQSGVVWEVFEIRNGRLTPIQRYYDNMSDYSWWGH